MRKLHEHWGRNEIIAYNLRPAPNSSERGTSYAVFAERQGYRVNLTRDAIARVLAMHEGERMSIIEPGCSAGDISGFFAERHDVWMNDVVPAAVAASRQRWPNAMTEEGAAEDFAPRACDILVMCEFLEHIEDPITFVKEWMPLARYAIISHPLVGDGHDPEKGHFWAYDINDFRNWFWMAGHELIFEQPFRMGYHMILGIGRRK